MAGRFLFDGPANAATTVVLAHGAGAAMDAPGMTAISGALANTGLRIARFEFGYMAARRTGQRRPPPRADRLVPEYREAVEALGLSGRLIIGGKSMGGRVASMVADTLHAEGAIAGLLCLGYPFHPIGKPDKLRTGHLEELVTPTLICQGTRDPFGTPDEVASYPLSERIALVWLEDGDHELKPRKRVSGYSHADHLATMAEAVSGWAAGLGPSRS